MTTHWFPIPYVTKYLECKVDRHLKTYEEIPYHEVGIGLNCMKAGHGLRPITKGEAKITYNSMVVPLDFVKGSNQSDEYFIAAIPRKEFEAFLSNNPQVQTEIMDDQGNPKKTVCYAWYHSGRDHDEGWPTDLKMEFFVSDSPNNAVEGAPFGDGKTSLKKTGIFNIKDHVLVPCKVKEYNAKVLNPSKALKRWHKRDKLEREHCLKRKRCYNASLRDQISVMNSRLEWAHEAREFEPFAALDLGGGPLANTWIVAVADMLPPASMHVLDIDNRALLAGASVYGRDLARVGFHWEERAKQASAFQTDYPDEKFDFIMAINSIENIVNSACKGIQVEEHRDYGLTDERRRAVGRKLFMELDRILKPRGRLYLSTFWGNKKSRAYPYCFTFKELRSFATDTRLRILRGGGPGRYKWKHTDGKHTEMLFGVFEKELTDIRPGI